MTNEQLTKLRADLLDLEEYASKLGILTEADEIGVARARNLSNKCRAAKTWPKNSEAPK